MKKFDITKKIKLDYLGKEWSDCYLEFEMPPFNKIKEFVGIDEKDPEAAEKGITLLKDLFRSGKAVSEGKVVEVAKDDIGEFPVVVLTKCIQQISGEIDPK